MMSCKHPQPTDDEEQNLYRRALNGLEMRYASAKKVTLLDLGRAKSSYYLVHMYYQFLTGFLA